MISLEQASAFAIWRHGIGGGCIDARTAARATLGLHAQLLTSAALSAAARVPQYGREQLAEELYRERTVVKVWSMRGTLHLVAVDDLPLFIYGVMLRRAAGAEDFYRQSGLTRDEIARLPRRVREALTDGPLTRKRLHQLVPELQRIPEAQWGQDIKDLCYRGLVVHAEPDGTEVRFADVDWWLKAPIQPLSEAEAAARLLRRYLGSYGPASAADFSAWAGFGRVADAVSARDRLEEQVVEVEVEGCHKPLWLLKSDLTAAVEPPAPGAFALPKFDPLVLGLKDRRRFVCDEWRKQLLLPGGFVAATLWVGGRIVGIWEHRLRGTTMEVTATGFRDILPSERAGLERGLSRLAPTVGAEEIEVRFS